MPDHIALSNTVQSNDSMTISYLTYPWQPGLSLTNDGDLADVQPPPGLIILHGGLKLNRAHTELVSSLSSILPIYLPGRRGRCSSSPHGDGYSIQTEISDVKALLLQTGAISIFGVSGGAMVAIAAAIEFLTTDSDPLIEKVIIFEPHLVFDD
jgi:pimeloyl-ACP methyl ester carboxylesterase